MWKQIQKMKKARHSAVILTHGTLGFGKSHMIAASVTYGWKKDWRVVYIGDAEQFSRAPVEVLKETLQIAYARDPSVLDVLDTVRNEDDMEDLLRTHVAKADLTFFMDKYNAIEESQLQLLERISYSHHVVFASSANHKRAHFHERFMKETSTIRIPLTGGFSDVSARFMAITR